MRLPTHMPPYLPSLSRSLPPSLPPSLLQHSDMTKYRLKHETHFPLPSEAPPTTDLNILRLKEMEVGAGREGREREVVVGGETG